MYISSKQMQEIDQYAINNLKIPSIILMENAAIKVLKNINLNNFNNFTIICGVGNNGGDGLALARHLLTKNKNIDLFIIGNLDKQTKDSKIFLNILKNLNLKYTLIKKQANLNYLCSKLKSNDITIDSIFGIGLKRDITGIYYQTIDYINKYSPHILSIDMPSGLCADKGIPLNISVEADKTVTFHQNKIGLKNNYKYTGKIIVEDISIPNSVTYKFI